MRGASEVALAVRRYRLMRTDAAARKLLGVNDTSPAANARYHELLRAMGPERRLETAMALSRGVRELSLSACGPGGRWAGPRLR